MILQKVCIIGGGLTGLVTTAVLSKLNIKVDFIVDNIALEKKSNRTTAISQNNYEFLKKLKIFNFSRKEFWPSSNMELYTKEKDEKFNKILEFNNKKNKKKQLLYMINNSAFINNILKNIKNNKKISIIKKKVPKIFSSGLLKSISSNSYDNRKYNLIIICTGNKSDLTRTIFNNQFFKHSYNEIVVTTTVKHKNLKNNIARQLFFEDEILALLPTSNTKTSIVWFAKKKVLLKNKNKFRKILENKIKFYVKNFLKEIRFVNTFECRETGLQIRNKYYKDRVLLFGDALHTVHPLAGQGFNMTIRDLISLETILKDKINLGLDIGSREVLSTFSIQNKPYNFFYSMGIDFIKKSFSFKSKSLKNLRNNTVSIMNRNNYLKDIFFKLANNGLKF